MSIKMTEGQMDFLGLLNEYTDDQGATVRIREPRSGKLKPVFFDEPEQMKLDFDCKEPKPEPGQDIKPEPKPDIKPEPEPKPEKETGPEAASEKKPAELLFKQCKRCWCFDCRHNSRNEGVVREMCGVMMACPACDGCISEDSATICEIGNAREGCRLRASEEGITEAEDPEVY